MRNCLRYVFCCAAHKRHIIRSVNFCINFCIFYCLRYNLNTKNLSRLLCKEQTNCSYSAIHVPYRFIFRNPCIFKRGAVKLFRLNWIYLIKRKRRYTKMNIPYHIFNISRSVQRNNLITHNPVRSFIINVKTNACHIWNFFKNINKFI